LQGISLSADEQRLLEAWLQVPANRLLFETEINAEELKEYLTVLMDKEATGRALARFGENAFGKAQTPGPSQTSHRVHFMRRAWVRYAAALILLTGAWFLFRTTKKAKDLPAPAVATSDVAPGSNKATLILADGSSITLDSANTGRLASQGTTKIVKTANGKIEYDQGGTATGEVFMNTMRVPRGGQYQLTLPDGTKVWLNAASSISYPTAFVGKDRMVSVIGEVYFEVAKKANMPFRVKVGDRTTILVLGTSFNINAYDDEADVRTTLLEGSVRIQHQVKSRDLAPGQQAVTSGAGVFAAADAIRVVEKVDVDKVMAWKNGYFDFDNVRFEEVMRQLQRWYEIDVVYSNGIPNIPLGGEISRNLKLSDLLKGLEGAGVKFRLEKGRRLVVFQ
jgi:ferric-dicitrate binding protein FerR (iron transport regulator)